jgi:hypothetical protein
MGNFELEIVGEAHDQVALEILCRPRKHYGVNQFETAYLILEDNNPRDKNAVRVEIRGKHVGYLSPKAASLFREQLIARGMPKGVGQCAAVIRGGCVSSDGRKGAYEVWLDNPTLHQRYRSILISSNTTKVQLLYSLRFCGKPLAKQLN